MDDRSALLDRLLAALRDTRQGVRHSLDVASGRVVSRGPGQGEADEDADADTLPIPRVGPEHGFETMRLFVTTVRNPSLRDRLQRATQGKGAFQRFREILAQQPRELQRWLAFRDRQLRERLAAWLASHGLSAADLARLEGPSAATDPRARLEELTLLVAYLSSWEEPRGPGGSVRRAWKAFRYDVLEKLQAQGLLTQGRSSKSLLLTAEGVARARQVEVDLGLAEASPSGGPAPPPAHRPRRASPARLNNRRRSIR